MIVVVCLDDLGGMIFNKRRQSRDRLLIEDLLNLVGSGTLWMDHYSRSLFGEPADCNIIVDDDFLKKAETGQYAFVEDRNVAPYLESIEKIVIYRWNRRYPRDLTFNVDLNDWILSESTEFPGYSHEVITREIYTR